MTAEDDYEAATYNPRQALKETGHIRACRYSGLTFTEAPASAHDCCCDPRPAASSGFTPEQKLDLLMAEPDQAGHVVRFQLGYPNSPKTYDYAAIRTAGGQWYVTGQDSPQGYRWPALLAWFEHKGATLHYMYLVNDWEPLL